MIKSNRRMVRNFRDYFFGCDEQAEENLELFNVEMLAQIEEIRKNRGCSKYLLKDENNNRYVFSLDCIYGKRPSEFSIVSHYSDFQMNSVEGMSFLGFYPSLVGISSCLTDGEGEFLKDLEANRIAGRLFILNEYDRIKDEIDLMKVAKDNIHYLNATLICSNSVVGNMQLQEL